MESTNGNAIRKDEIAKLLRYESTDFGAGELTSLEEYIERMKEDQRYIFYLPVKNRQQALSRYFLIDERFQISLVRKILDRRIFLMGAKILQRTPPRRLKIATQTLLKDIAKELGYLIGKILKVTANRKYPKNRK